MRLVYTVSSVLLLVFLALPVGVSAQGETPTPTETPFVLVTATPVPTPPTPTPDAVVLLREISARDSQVASMQLFGIAGGLGLLAFTLAVLMVGGPAMIGTYSALIFVILFACTVFLVLAGMMGAFRQ